MKAKLMMVALASATAFALRAANYYVGPNETRSVNVGVGLSGENISHRIYVSDGGTVKLTNPPASGDATLYNYIICSNGTVTVDVTDCAARPIRLAHGVRAKGELRIVGANAIKAGRAFDRGTTNLSVFDAPNVTFYEADGVTPYPAGKVVFDASSTLVALPKNGGTGYEIAAGTEMAFAGENVLGDSSVYELGDYDAVILGAKAFAPGAEIRVHAGRCLALKPCTITEDLLWLGTVAEVANDITLGGAGSSLALRSQEKVALNGRIGGEGRILEEYSGTASVEATIAGDVFLKGCVEISRSGYGLTLKGGDFSGADLTASAPDGSRIAFMPQSGVCSLRGIGPNVTVIAGKDATVNASVLPDGATICSKGATIACDLDLLSWTNEVGVTLWLDPNAADSVRILENPSGEKQKCDNLYVVEKWWDARLTEPGTRYAYNNRAYLNGSWVSGVNYVYPRLVPAGGDGPNGLAYIYSSTAIGSSPGRLYLFDESVTRCGGDQNTAANRAKFTIMVFGSKYSGGNAIIGGVNGPFIRAGDAKTSTTNSGVLANANHPIWIDGARVADPTTTGLSGGWQIISLQNGADSPLFLGWRNQYSDYAGGQQYGEIIFLDEVPTDAVRRRIEYYLAVKWGLAGQQSPAVVTSPRLSVRAIGDGTLAAKGDLDLSGAFSGQLAMDGGALTIVGEKAIPAAEEVDGDGLLAWFDPDLAETVVLETEPTKPNLIGYVYDRDPARRSGEGRVLYINEPNAAKPDAGDRCPYWYEGNWDMPFAPVRHWIDNANYYAGDNSGNAFRLRQAGNRTGSDTSGALTIRTAIMVQNSVRGGGTPILDAYLGHTGISRQTTDFNSVLYGAGAPDSLLKATIHVNGKLGSATTRPSGLTGKPEVLTIETAGDFSLSSLGFYANTESGRTQGEIFGEMLFFSKVLDAAVREGIEAYLQRKWTGEVRDGYADMRSLTVNGASSLSAAGLKCLPALGTGFAGEVTVADASTAFTFVGGEDSHVVNPLALDGATLVLPADGVITVRFTARPQAGTYPLISAGSIVGGDLTLATTGPLARREVELVREGGTLSIRVTAPGLMLLVR